MNFINRLKLINNFENKERKLLEINQGRRIQNKAEKIWGWATPQKVKICILLFTLALLVRLLFYILGSAYLPPNFLKFVTADTTYYYDPIALNMASHNTQGVSLLSTTRFTFLNYLALFYRYL